MRRPDRPPSASRRHRSAIGVRNGAAAAHGHGRLSVQFIVLQPVARLVVHGHDVGARRHPHGDRRNAQRNAVLGEGDLWLACECSSFSCSRITAGGALAFGTYNYVQNMPAQTVSMPTKPVVVAAADLDIGAELRAEDVRIIEWPANAVPADAIGDPERRHRPRPRHAGDPERADPADEAGVEGSRRRPAAGDSARPARRVGARQRSHRRRRLRAARARASTSSRRSARPTRQAT